jgi:hypothetical protein
MKADSVWLLMQPVLVNNYNAVSAIQSRYSLNFSHVDLERHPDGTKTLRLRGNAWPRAIRTDRLRTSEEYPAILDEYGDKDFIEFLQELGRHLVDPFLLQAIERWGLTEPLDAREWYVQPGSTTVEVNGFKHGYDGIDEEAQKPDSPSSEVDQS